jgi:hypothetical protein
LLFVQLDDSSKPPAWLPDTHVRFALEQYGIDQLAIAAEFNGHVFLPAERMMTAFPPNELRRKTFLPALSLSRGTRQSRKIHAHGDVMPGFAGS